MNNLAPKLREGGLRHHRAGFHPGGYGGDVLVLEFGAVGWHGHRVVGRALVIDQLHEERVGWVAGDEDVGVVASFEQVGASVHVEAAAVVAVEVAAGAVLVEDWLDVGHVELGASGVILRARGRLGG